jgi:hypothetical protein
VRAGEVFARECGRHNRDAGQQVRTEFALGGFEEKFLGQWNPAEHKRGDQREPTDIGIQMPSKAQRQVERNCRDEEHGDYCMLPQGKRFLVHVEEKFWSTILLGGKSAFTL